MWNKIKTALPLVPAFLVAAALIISASLKIWGNHPMLHHFVEMGFYPWLSFLGAAEIIFAVLFILPQTTRIGLLLLTAYFGGAIAVEVPYGQMAAPFVLLLLIWLAAWLKQPSLFQKTYTFTYTKI